MVKYLEIKSPRKQASVKFESKSSKHTQSSSAKSENKRKDESHKDTSKDKKSKISVEPMKSDHQNKKGDAGSEIVADDKKNKLKTPIKTSDSHRHNNTDVRSIKSRSLASSDHIKSGGNHHHRESSKSHHSKERSESHDSKHGKERSQCHHIQHNHQAREKGEKIMEKSTTATRNEMDHHHQEIEKVTSKLATKLSVDTISQQEEKTSLITANTVFKQLHQLPLTTNTVARQPTKAEDASAVATDAISWQLITPEKTIMIFGKLLHNFSHFATGTI